MTTKSDAELTKLLADTRASLREERYSAAGARAKDPSAARAFRATIARVRTELTARTGASSTTASGSRPSTSAAASAPSGSRPTA